jgi:hypothetical protein
MSSDPAAAALDGIRGRWAARKQYSLGFNPVDASRLLAAVEAASELADEWRAVGSPESAEEEALMWQQIESGERLREAITAALTGTLQGEDGEHG